MQHLIKRFAPYLAVAFACLTIGYFAGREHLKYEVRTAFQDAAERITSGIGQPSSSAASADVKPPQPSRTTEDAPMAVTLVKKGFQERDFENGVYQQGITLEVSFTNKTSKDIRAFDGVLTFSDLLDNQIISSKVAVNETVKAGDTLTWSGQLDYNQFMVSHTRLRSEDQANLKIAFNPRKVLFADGTTQEFE